MEQISFCLTVKKIGKVYVIPLDKRFADAMKIKEGDNFLPVLIPFTKDDISTNKPDSLLGNNFLGLILQRWNAEGIMSFISNLRDTNEKQ